MSRFSNYASIFAIGISLAAFYRSHSSLQHAEQILKKYEETVDSLEVSVNRMRGWDSASAKEILPEVSLERKLDGLYDAVQELGKITRERDSIQAIMDSLASTGKKDDYQKAFRIGKSWEKESNERLKVKVDAFGELLNLQ